MRYIKQIMHSRDGYIPSAREGFWGRQLLSVQVHDTERNSDSVCTFLSLDEGRELGYGISQDYRVYVRLGGKTLALHSFIDSVERIDTYKCDDFALLSTGSLNLDASKEPGAKAIHISTDRSVIRIFGLLGSCVTRQDESRGAIKVMSLYELLAHFCQRFNLNIMQYREVVVQCYEDSCHVIRLKHTPEADRFFMKMYLDVMRR